MIKIFALLFSLYTLGFSAILPVTKGETSIYIDTQNQETLDTIVSKKESFTIEKNSKRRILDKAIWTHFTLSNNSSKNQSLILSSTFRLVRYIDVLVIHQDATRETHLIGSNREHKFIHSNLGRYPLTLRPNEHVDIYTRHITQGVVGVNWNINETGEYYAKKSIEDIFKGVAFGIVFIFLLVIFIIYNITKEISSLFLGGLLFFGLLSVLTATGTLYNFNYSLGLFFRENIIVFPSLVYFFESLFIISVFRLKQNATLLYKIFSLISLVSISFSVLALYFTFTITPIFFIKIFVIYTIVFSIFVTLFTIYAIYKRWNGAIYFLVAIVLISYLRLSKLGYFDQGSIFALLLIGAILTVLFLILIVVLLKMKNDYYKKIKAENIILNNAKYLSIGKLHAATIHQLKTPISQIGAISARIEIIFERHKSQLDHEEYISSSKLTKIITMANDTISDLYNLYSADQEKEHFDIKEAISEIMLPLQVLSKSHAITMNFSLENAPAFNYPNALKHILIVIIENAMDILIERKTKDPAINISLTQNGSYYKIEICDNAGGIKVKPIENIFEMYKSHKEKPGLGLGLALAKNLAYMLETEIRVENTKDGACFTLNIDMDN